MVLRSKCIIRLCISQNCQYIDYRSIEFQSYEDCYHYLLCLLASSHRWGQLKNVAVTRVLQKHRVSVPYTPSCAAPSFLLVEHRCVPASIPPRHFFVSPLDRLLVGRLNTPIPLRDVFISPHMQGLRVHG